MKGQNCVRQLHLDGSLALRLKVSDNGVQGLTWQGCGQPCADFERPIQIELRRRIIPVGNIRPESPGKLLRRVALDRILKLPGWFAHAMGHLGRLPHFTPALAPILCDVLVNGAIDNLAD